MHDLVFQNAKLLRNSKWEIANIAIADGKFSSFAPSAGKETIDLKGQICLPGAVDLHVHFNEPGRTHWEGFATGALAAAAGGTTFLVEMPLNSIPSTVSVESLRTKLQSIGSKSLVDFALWGGLVPGNVQELQALAAAGVAGFKAFMSPSGVDNFQNSDHTTLAAGMKEIAKTGKILAIHAEDPAVLERVASKMISKESALDWERSRPIEAEISAVKIAVELAGETGCRIHIVHVSAPEVLETIAEAKAKGLDITCETCPHYLLLPIEQADTIGPAAKCAPPLRPQGTIDRMWECLRAGTLNTIGSDHSPSPPDMKVGKSYYDAWGGISGLQHGLPLLWEYAYDDNALLQTLIDLSTSNPVNLIGATEKGAIEIGRDADFVLVDLMEKPEIISQDSLLYRHKLSPYVGMKTKFRVRQTWQRGECVYRDGRSVGKPKGKFRDFSQYCC